MGIHTGISSLLMLLVVLSLTMFGLLSYTTASADARLSDRAAQHTQEYYAAEALAEEALAKLDAYLAAAPDRSSALEGAAEAAGGTVEDGHILVALPVNSTQRLELRVRVEPENGARYTELSRVLVSTRVFQSESHLNVWMGE